MTVKMQSRQSLIDMLILAVLGGTGGGVAYLQQYLEHGKFRVSFFLAQVVISGFCGSLTGFAVTKTWPEWGYIAAGVAGIFGIQLIYLIFNLWLRATGKDIHITTDDLEIHSSKSGEKK